MSANRPRRCPWMMPPMPVERIPRLGSLVTDKWKPDIDFHEIEDVTPDPWVTEERDCKRSHYAESKSTIMSTIAQSFGIGAADSTSDTIAVEAQLITTRTLKNTDAFFQYLMNKSDLPLDTRRDDQHLNPTDRKLKDTLLWIQDREVDSHRIFLLTGIVTVTNARIHYVKERASVRGGSLRAPMAEILSAGASQSFSGRPMDLAIAFAGSREEVHDMTSVMDGEHVVALQYSEVKLSRIWWKKTPERINPKGKVPGWQWVIGYTRTHEDRRDPDAQPFMEATLTDTIDGDLAVQIDNEMRPDDPRERPAIKNSVIPNVPLSPEDEEPITDRVQYEEIDGVQLIW